jgi:hypothetical protein
MAGISSRTRIVPMGVYENSSRIASSVELSNDVWLTILDYRYVSTLLKFSFFANIFSTKINVLTDLRSLCLTSRVLRELATPRLHKTIIIPLCNGTAVDTFIRSVSREASRHLGNTRILVFEDTRPPQEPESIISGATALPPSLGSTLNANDKDRTVDIIFQTIPEARLYSFRSAYFFPTN